MIGSRRPKLINQVLVCTRDLHPIQSGFTDPDRSFGKVGDDALDFMLFYDFRRTAVHWLTDTARRDQVRPVTAPVSISTAHVRRLNHDLRTVSMHSLSEVAQMRNGAVIG